MIKKRSHLRSEDRTVVVSAPDIVAGIRTTHEIKADPYTAILVLKPDNPDHALNRPRFNVRFCRNPHDDPDLFTVYEWNIESSERLFWCNEDQSLIIDTNKDLVLLAQTQGAAAADVGGGVVGFAAEAVPPIMEAAGAGAGVGVGVASGMAAVGVFAVFSGTTLIAAPSSTMQASGMEATAANKTPAKIMLSANVIQSGAAALATEESAHADLRIGELLIMDSDGVSNSIRLGLLPDPDANFFEIREMLGSDQMSVIGHDLYYIGPTPDFNLRQSYTIVIESTDNSSAVPLVFAKTLTIVVSVDTFEAIGWLDSAWVTGATLHLSDDPGNALIDRPLCLQASPGDDWLLGTPGNDFFSGMATGDIFIGGDGIDGVQLDGSVVPTGGPIRVGFYPGGALQPLPDDLIQTGVLPSFDGVLSWGNEVLIQAEQIRFMLPDESITRVFSTEPLEANYSALPEGSVLIQSDPYDPAYLGTHRLMLSSEDDWVVFGDSNGVLDAGAGNDCVVTTAAYSIVSGGSGDDWLLAGDPAEDSALAVNLGTRFFGNAGNDVMVALAGRVDAWGGEGHNTFILASSKATLIVHDYVPGVDSIVWTELEGLAVFKTTDNNGSTTFFYSEAKDPLLQSTTVVQGSELSHDWWPQNAIDTINTLRLSSVTWITA